MRKILKKEKQDPTQTSHKEPGKTPGKGTTLKTGVTAIPETTLKTGVTTNQEEETRQETVLGKDTPHKTGTTPKTSIPHLIQKTTDKIKTGNTLKKEDRTGPKKEDPKVNLATTHQEGGP